MRRMTADQEVYNRIRAINDQMLACTSHELWIRYDIAFHKALLHESGLKTLVAFGDLLELFFHRFRENVEDPEWKSGIESHSRILEFLSKGKLFNAGEELSFHISSRTVQFRDPTA
jgi:DNA-binding FadR family transcriptional regulator